MMLKRRLESLIGDIHAKIEIHQIAMMEPTSATSRRVEPRKSSRERKLTPKMLELKQQEASQRESKFIKLNESWKEQVRATPTKLKGECSEQDLGGMMETQVRDVFENIRSQSAPSTEIRRKIDSCTAVTTDLMGLVKVRMSEAGQEEFDAKAENARLHMLFDKEYAQSISGTTISKSTVCRHHSSCLSGQQSITAKRAECAAQFAAKQAEVEMKEAIAARRQELKRLENQRDLQVIATKLKVTLKLTQVRPWRKVEQHGSEPANCPPIPYKEIKGEQTCKNNSNEQIDTNNAASLVQALHDAMILSRLPTPEPSVFSGDPLKVLRVEHKFQGIDRTATHKSS
ncbi:uncharacterized protein [Hemitrygon akajei]|uniref:uncharacterized protein n=1 Tax=Hemitrygon akajei TaxID=2704970 RepID=UPI003BF9585A